MIKLTGEESWGSISMDFNETYEVKGLILIPKLSEDVSTCEKCALNGTQECFVFNCPLEGKNYLIPKER